MILFGPSYQQCCSGHRSMTWGCRRLRFERLILSVTILSGCNAKACQDDCKYSPEILLVAVRVVPAKKASGSVQVINDGAVVSASVQILTIQLAQRPLVAN